MSLPPRFFNRIADATLPVLGTIDRAALEQQLHDVAVALQAVPAVTDALSRPKDSSSPPTSRLVSTRA